MAKISGKNIDDIPGTMKDFSGATVPLNYLACDGSSYLVTTYPALFAAIGYIYGGSGANFNVPNMQRRVAIGSGGTQVSGPGTTTGSTGGSEAQTISQANLPSVSFPVSDPGHKHLLIANAPINNQPISGSTQISIDQGGSIGGGSGQIGGCNTGAGLGLSGSASIGISVGSGGSGTPQNVMQPSMVVTKIIKY